MAKSKRRKHDVQRVITLAAWGSSKPDSRTLAAGDFELICRLKTAGAGLRPAPANEIPLCHSERDCRAQNDSSDVQAVCEVPLVSTFVHLLTGFFYCLTSLFGCLVYCLTGLFHRSFCPAL